MCTFINVNLIVSGLPDAFKMEIAKNGIYPRKLQYHMELTVKEMIKPLLKEGVIKWWK